ncbi:MAG: hypothetical protein HC856_08430 [Pseudanabaena sp. RU_4_16]|nr:hypothetical protein [Pseudanabaena sp. RU_4_16]
MEYIRSEFSLVDATGKIRGDWWGHYSYELPEGKCDAIVELVDNTYKKSYQVRLIDFIDLGIESDNASRQTPNKRAIALGIDKVANSVKVIDARGKSLPLPTEAIICDVCPTSWQELDRWITQATILQKPLVLTYTPPVESNGIDAWKILVGIAKYLSRTGSAIALKQLQAKLNIDDFTVLQFGLDALSACGWEITLHEQILQMQLIDPGYVREETAIGSATQANAAVQKFITTVNELIFRQQYFDRQLLRLVQSNSSHRTSLTFDTTGA